MAFNSKNAYKVLQSHLES